MSQHTINSPCPLPKPPGTYNRFVSKFPALGEAHEQVANAVAAAGPMDAKTCELVKIGIALGAGLETAVRSHVRKAVALGAAIDEVEQAILLGMNTCGFPRTVAAWQWAWQQIERDQAEAK